MPELLIKAIDATNPNPVQDALCYNRNDIVVVMPDGHPWGSHECLGAFLVIHIDGDLADLLQYTEPVESYDILTGETIMTKRRKYKFDIDANITSARLAEIAASPTWLIDSFPITSITAK